MHESLPCFRGFPRFLFRVKMEKKTIVLKLLLLASLRGQDFKIIQGFACGPPSLRPSVLHS